MIRPFTRLNSLIDGAEGSLENESMAEGIYGIVLHIIRSAFGAAALTNVGPDEGEALILPIRREDLPILELRGFTTAPEVVKRETGDREGIQSTNIRFDNDTQVLTLGITRGSLPKGLTP